MLLMMVYAQNTHNGDEIHVDGESYVVQGIVLTYKLVHGKYRPDHRRLEVHRTGRFLYNRWVHTMHVFAVCATPVET